MKLRKQSLKEAALKTIIASIISIPATLFFMDYYAAITVSIDPNNIVDTMTQGAVINTVLLVAVTVFLSSYIKIDDL